MTKHESQARILKAEALRYQKPIVYSLNWEHITERIYEIYEECSCIHWMTEDEEELIDLLDGDEEKAFEFRIAFSSLEADCTQMMDDMDEIRRYDFMGADINDDGAPMFDLFFPAVTNDEVYGFDTVIGDYFPLTSYQITAAMDVAKKRLKRMTKDQILDLAGMSLNVARDFTSLEYRYNSLKGCIDILRGKNDGVLSIVKSLEDAWEKWDMDGDERALNRQLSEMPDRLWIE